MNKLKSILLPKIVLVRYLKNFANSLPSASNFKSFSRPLEQFFLTVVQNNFGNKIPFLKNSWIHIKSFTSWNNDEKVDFCKFAYLKNQKVTFDWLSCGGFVHPCWTFESWCNVRTLLWSSLKKTSWNHRKIVTSWCNDELSIFAHPNLLAPAIKQVASRRSHQ